MLMASIRTHIGYERLWRQFKRIQPLHSRRRALWMLGFARAAHIMHRLLAAPIEAALHH